MNDDELSSFLMGEIPEPGGDFWGELHDRLEDAAGAEPAPARADDDADASSDNDAGSDHDVTQVIDLGAVREQRGGRGRGAWLAAAAAIILFAGGALLFANLTDSDTRTIASQPEPTAEPATIDGEPGDDAGDGAGNRGREIVELPTDQPAWWKPRGVNPVEARSNPDDNEATATLAPRSALVATGARVSVDGIELVELGSGVGVEPLWVLVDEVERLGDLLPAFEPATYAPIGPGQVSVLDLPDRVSGRVVRPLAPVERLESAGRRALVAGEEWLEVTTSSGEIGWVGIDEVVAVQRNNPQPSRQCLVNGDDLIIIDFGSAVAFVGVRALGDSTDTFDGSRLTDPSVTPGLFGVNLGTGPAEEWRADDSTLTTGDGTVYSVAACADLADRIEQVEQAVLANAEEDVSRNCYVGDGTVLVVNPDGADGIFTGALRYFDSVEAFSGRPTAEVREGATSVLDVNTSPIGSEEAGTATVTRVEWVISEIPQDRPYTLTSDRLEVENVNCDEIGDEVAQLVELVRVFPEPPG